MVVAGTPRSPEVVERRRIEIADPAIEGSKQPYHEAEDRDLRDAERFLKRCEEASGKLAKEAVASAVADARKRGYDVVACGLLLALGRPLPALEKILASHALIHTADGEHFRAALTRASERCGLAVTRIPEREVFDRASAGLRMPAEEIRRRVGELGKILGPPWAQDQKMAALVGWLALSARTELR